MYVSSLPIWSTLKVVEPTTQATPLLVVTVVTLVLAEHRISSLDSALGVKGIQRGNIGREEAQTKGYIKSTGGGFQAYHSVTSALFVFEYGEKVEAFLEDRAGKGRGSFAVFSSHSSIVLRSDCPES